MIMRPYFLAVNMKVRAAEPVIDKIIVEFDGHRPPLRSDERLVYRPDGLENLVPAQDSRIVAC